MMLLLVLFQFNKLEALGVFCFENVDEQIPFSFTFERQSGVETSFEYLIRAHFIFYPLALSFLVIALYICKILYNFL